MNHLIETDITISKSRHSRYITGSGLMKKLAEIVKENLEVKKIILISDRKVYQQYGLKILHQLHKLTDSISVYLLPGGEKGKDMSHLQIFCRKILSRHINRESCLIAFGGGSVSDSSGFLASILLRGIKLILIPTTLLAMVDAAIGGKNGLNLKINNKLLKNMIGTFYQPDLVISDINLLETLPEREIKNGFAEIVKYRIIFGRPDIENQALPNLIEECQKIKLAVVSQDPFDKNGVREKLNLGHTIGHALESAAKGRYSHGEAVAIGLAASASISMQMNLLPQEIKEKIMSWIKLAGLPVKAKELNQSAILRNLTFDKKGGNFVLIKDIGNVIVRQKVPLEIIKRSIKEVIS